MSQAHHYRADRRDLEFNLFEYLRVQEHVLGHGEYQSMDEDVARDALRGLEKICTTALAESYAAADREPPTFSDGVVILPDSLKRSINQFTEDGWQLLEVPERMGGFGAPPSVAWAGFEMVVGANPPIAFYVFGSFIARVIERLGTETQKARYLPQMLDRKWGAAMVLTEPDAGSDVGSARAKARHLEGDVWAIEGVKRFITNGDYDQPENIVHLVLARPEGAKGGTKGLSMFIVPKFWVEEDGSIGARNGMRCTAIEKKMGLKGSVTCEMTYGDGEQCRGLLVGEVHNGIAQMFHVIEQARMAVGVKSISTLSTAYFHALEYAKERVQGADLKEIMNKAAPRVPIIRHPDVRRMLMTQKAHAYGMRALALYTANIQDQVELLGGHGNPEAIGLERLNDLLLPLVKGFCSDRTWSLLKMSLQCFGGAGYCMDYPIEQYIRDQKIDTLYEGTTHIQSLDLLFRKVARDQGQTLQSLFARIQATIDATTGGEQLTAPRAKLARALQDVQGIFMAMMSKFGESLYHVGMQGNRVLLALGDLVVGWLLVEHAALAAEKLESATGADANFYRGKIAAARWFCHEQLPTLTLARKQVEASDLEVAELDEAIF